MDHMDEDDIEIPGVSYDELVSEINKHEASHLIMLDRNDVNGMVMFRFYGKDSQCKGQLRFDSIDDDMAFRAGAVLDFLSQTENFVIDQMEIEGVWNNAKPNAGLTL